MSDKPSIETIRLTKYSHGSGCGCKIAPGVLENILKTQIPSSASESLIVGNDTRDDAAVYDIGDGRAIISTTDFFMPIVDDPFDFGRIASVNAISDIYAMGGRPIMAIAILGWPLDKLPPETANRVVEGGRMACMDAGIPLAGGHSIDNPEPIFGLAVSGIVSTDKIRRNDTAKEGAVLFLTKPIGIGIMSTAKKKGTVDEGHFCEAVESMMRLNNIGAELEHFPGISSITDVTGFGLMGHLREMCQGSGVSAEIIADRVPVFSWAEKYISEGFVPGGTERNFKSYGHDISEMSDLTRNLLCDPQTSGGLLIAVEESHADELARYLRERGMPDRTIGRLIPQTKPLIRVI